MLHWTSGWTDWNLALNMNGGPNWAQNWCDAPIIVDEINNGYYKQPSFYAMGHFSKFLPPGSIRIGTNIVNDTTNSIEWVAFARPDSGIVLILLNLSNSDVQLSLNDPNLGSFTSSLTQNSIQSYLWYP